MHKMRDRDRLLSDPMRKMRANRSPENTGTIDEGQKEGKTMKTLDEIRKAIIKLSAGQPITRGNYDWFADQVIPHNDYPVRAARAKMVGTPAGQVYVEAQNINTVDWLDMACIRASINQVKLAAKGRS